MNFQKEFQNVRKTDETVAVDLSEKPVSRDFMNRVRGKNSDQ